ncbi:MAG: hypothetical protein KBT31_06890 [Firmicutes bacterium]|nr:hypothetical protein [Candidatus Colimorpha enterica]
MKRFTRFTRFITLALTAAIILCFTASCGEDKGFNIPIICGETDFNNICGVATYGVDYYSLGVKAGDMAADILLNGADPKTMAVATDPNPSLSVNSAVAEAIGFNVPADVAAKATSGASNEVARKADAIVTENADFTVGILQLVQHVALDKANKGFQDELSVRMSEAGKKVCILDQNASNDQSNNTTISESFVSKNVDLIYAIATSSAQAAASAAAESSIPVLFNAVTDPVSSGLVDSLDKPGRNVTGVSDINPVAKQIDLAADLLGKSDITVGFLFTSSETNSVYQVELGKKGM